MEAVAATMTTDAKRLKRQDFYPRNYGPCFLSRFIGWIQESCSRYSLERVARSECREAPFRLRRVAFRLLQSRYPPFAVRFAVRQLALLKFSIEAEILLCGNVPFAVTVSAEKYRFASVVSPSCGWCCSHFFYISSSPDHTSQHRTWRSAVIILRWVR